MSFDFNTIPVMLGNALHPIAQLFTDSAGFYREHVAGTVEAIGRGEAGAIIGAALVLLVIAAVLVIAGRKEPHRRFLVALKRKPQNIPLAILAIAFVVYSFNLTHISNTTTLVQGPNMGLTGFVTMLGSILMLVCCLNAYPYRKKIKKPMMILMFIMIAVIMFCDCHYYNCIVSALTREEGAIAATADVTAAKNVVCVHFLILLIGAAAAAFLPLYAKLIRRIRTSIDVEGNEDMAAIDIAGE